MEKLYAFVNEAGVVVQAIRGFLPQDVQERFLSDYRVLFGAEVLVEVESDRQVWIGGLYADGVFTPAPEPQPEPLPEPQPEPEI